MKAQSSVPKITLFVILITHNLSIFVFFVVGCVCHIFTEIVKKNGEHRRGGRPCGAVAIAFGGFAAWDGCKAYKDHKALNETRDEVQSLEKVEARAAAPR